MKSSLPALGAAVLALLLLASFIIDALNVAPGGSIDYRNRVTGARLMTAGINPYTYKWAREDPESYCDLYNNPRLPVSKTTATPAMLELVLPFDAVTSYRADQWLWLIAQWLLLLATGWLWWRRCKSFRTRLLLGTIVTALTYTAAWRLHVERGQSYVLLLFLFAFWLTGTFGSTRPRFLTGFAAGLLMTLRPPFLLLVPILAWRGRGQLAGAATGLLVGVVVPLFFSGSIWTDYFSAMETHSYLYRFGIDPPPGPHPYPPTIEGIPTDTLAHYVAIPYADFSVHGLLRRMGLEPLPALPVLAPALLLFGLWAWWARRQEPVRFLAGLAIWMFLLDLFLPAYRDTYNDVMILNVIALGLLVAPRFSPGVVLSLAALVAGFLVYALAPEQAWLIDLPSLLLTLGALGFLLLPRVGPKLDSAPGSVQNEAC